MTYEKLTSLDDCANIKFKNKDFYVVIEMKRHEILKLHGERIVKKYFCIIRER